jgi:HNH endonuclease
MKRQLRGDKNPSWKGGRNIDKSGYVRVLLAEPHPRVHDRYIREHVLVMEKHLGRYLKPNEVVHHINGNKQDNRIENLQLVTISEHRKIHAMKDMDGRKCSVCSQGTRTRPYNDRPDWYGDTNGNLLCNKCYMVQYRRYLKLKKKDGSVGSM